MGIPKHVYIAIEQCNSIGTKSNNSLIHEFGHVWDLTSATVSHVHGSGRKPHDNIDECVMSYGRNRNSTSPEFCIDCLNWLRKKINF